MDRYHLCSYLRRDGVLHPYGVDAPLRGYSYFYGKLKNWLIDKMNHQKDFGPLENIYGHLKSFDLLFYLCYKFGNIIMKSLQILFMFHFIRKDL